MARIDGSAALACGSAALYLAVAVGPVAALMGRAARGVASGVPWGDICLLLGGTVAAAAAARAIACSGSLGGALRAAGTAHGTAAIATVAVCAGLAHFPGPRPLVGAGTTDPLLPMVYTRAVEPFFLPQLVLGLAAAVVFRAVTRPVAPLLAERLRPDSGRWGGERWMAALSVALYLAVIAAAYGGLLRQRPTFTPHSLPDARIAFLLGSIPVLIGSLAAASSAGRIARSRLEAAMGLAIAVHLVAAAASAVLMGLAWAAFRYSGPDPIVRGFRVAQPISLTGVLLHALAGATASFLFWVVVPSGEGADDGRTAAAVHRTQAPVGPDGVLVTCAGAFLYLAAALVPVLGFMERGWKPLRYRPGPELPWAELVVLAIGTLAMAAAAAPAARVRSLARALDVAGLAHLAGAMATAAVSVFVVIPRLTGALFPNAVPRTLTVEETARGLAPYLVVQIALGLAITVVLHRATGRRLAKGAVRVGSPALLEWARPGALAAVGAACFLALDCLAVAPGLAEITGGRREMSDPRVRTTIAFGGIALAVGTIVAAASAGAIARARASAAVVIGASMQFLGGCLVVPLAVPGMILREYAEPASRTLGQALQIGVLGTVFGPYAVSLVPFGDALLFAIWSLTGGYGTVILSWAALAIVQAVSGAVSALLIWGAAGSWARRAAG